MKIGSQQPRKNLSSRGFTLFELVTVIAIMSVLIALAVPSICSIANGRNIANAVDITSDLAATARQQALTSGSPIALILSPLPASGLVDAHQSLLLLQGTQSGSGTYNWKTATPWIKLPNTVLLAPYARNSASSFYSSASSSGTASYPLSSTVNGIDLSTCSYVIFLPDGTVLAPQAGPAISLTRANKSGTNADYVVLIQQDSGRSKIIAQ
jgi:prepilin-type N-terminal cleavage/methylation domain-containing protein